LRTGLAKACLSGREHVVGGRLERVEGGPSCRRPGVAPGRSLARPSLALPGISAEHVDSRCQRAVVIASPCSPGGRPQQGRGPRSAWSGSWSQTLRAFLQSGTGLQYVQWRGSRLEIWGRALPLGSVWRICQACQDSSEVEEPWAGLPWPHRRGIQLEPWVDGQLLVEVEA
jgi:hypothetical protein